MKTLALLVDDISRGRKVNPTLTPTQREKLNVPNSQTGLTTFDALVLTVRALKSTDRMNGLSMTNTGFRALQDASGLHGPSSPRDTNPVQVSATSTTDHPLEVITMTFRRRIPVSDEDAWTQAFINYYPSLVDQTGSRLVIEKLLQLFEPVHQTPKPTREDWANSEYVHFVEIMKFVGLARTTEATLPELGMAMFTIIGNKGSDECALLTARVAYEKMSEVYDKFVFFFTQAKSNH